MRFETTTKFWMVTDPKWDSELADICYPASLADLYLQFRGGFTLEDNPTLFTGQTEAEREAQKRLAMRKAPPTNR